MTDGSQADPTPEWRNLYGRRKGKPLRPGQAALMETRLAELAVPLGAPLDLAALLPGAGDFRLEIGFGGGEHLAAQALANPGSGFIGAEHYLNGVAKLLAQMQREGQTNVRLHHGDARDLMDVIPDAALSTIYVLYPDPWPKLRHAKRRFIGKGNLDAFARILAPGGVLRVASDIPVYIEWSLEQAGDHPAFERVMHDAATPWDDWPGTRYEAKALREGRAPAYLTFRRR